MKRTGGRYGEERGGVGGVSLLFPEDLLGRGGGKVGPGLGGPGPDLSCKDSGSLLSQWTGTGEDDGEGGGG